jgi:SAM-dependent methyltransferase
MEKPTDGEHLTFYGTALITARVGGRLQSRKFVLTDRSYDQASSTYPPWVLKGKVLEIGCGRYGLFVQGLRSRNVDAYGVDIAAAPDAPSVISRASSTELPYADGEFETVISFNSILDYADLNNPADVQVVVATLSEIFRVLKIGGKLILHASPQLRALIAERFPRVSQFAAVSGRTQFQKIGN